MGNLNLASFIFLVVLFVLVPRAALRSARQLRQAQASGAMPPRTRIVISTMFSLTVVWFIAQLNAAAMGYSLFRTGAIGAREAGAGLMALAVLLVTIPLARAMRRPEEDRRRLIFSLAPRTRREWMLFALLAVMAGIAEESAYRGVAVWILTPVFGSIVPAVFLSAMAFGVAHAVQGAKAMVTVFGIALVLQLLVYVTKTLVIAMVVHAVYDVAAGYAASKRAKALQVSDSGAASPAAPMG